MKLSRMLPAAAAIGAAALLGSGARAVLPLGWQVTIEDPGVQIGPSDQYFDSYGTETFNDWATSTNVNTTTFYASRTTDFGSGGVITGTYTNVYAHNADQYGGSTWDGNGARTDYVVAGLTNSQKTYSLTLNDTQSQNGNVNYFGFWLSALDANNSLTFLDNGQEIGSFTTADVLALVGGLPAYFGNPLTGENSIEPYVFINFLDLTGPGFDEIRFSEANGATAGYESDNHTVGWFDTITNPGGLCDVDPDCTVVPPASAVPEPASWAMMIAGFGLVGATMRRRPSLRFV